MGREQQKVCKEEFKSLPANRLSAWHSALPDDGLETTTERCLSLSPGAECREEGGRRRRVCVRVLVGAEKPGLSPGPAGHSSGVSELLGKYRPLQILLLHSDSCAVSLQRNPAHACPPLHHFTPGIPSSQPAGDISGEVTSLTPERAPVQIPNPTQLGRFKQTFPSSPLQAAVPLNLGYTSPPSPTSRGLVWPLPAPERRGRHKRRVSIAPGLRAGASREHGRSTPGILLAS